MSQLTSTNRPRSWPFHLFSFTLRGCPRLGTTGEEAQDNMLMLRHQTQFLGFIPTPHAPAYACARLDVEDIYPQVNGCGSADFSPRSGTGGPRAADLYKREIGVRELGN
jgi:hypothetical protein